MKKHVVIACILILASHLVNAQKYALIEQTLSHPVRFVNTVTPQDIHHKLLPVESKFLSEFLKALQSINQDLEKKTPPNKARDFSFGCTHINGMAVALGNEKRFNYVINSNCEAMNASFLLCDAKFKNKTNSFIVSTWIKYLKANMRKEGEGRK